MELKFCLTTIFRETHKVTFFDADIESTNGCDVVMHTGEAICLQMNLSMSSTTCTIIKSSKVSG